MKVTDQFVISAVILIDPHQCRLESTVKPSLSVDLVDPSYLRDITREFRLGSSFNNTIRQQQHRIFDALAEAYDKHDIKTSENPFTATILARNIVRSIWEEFVIREATSVHDILFNDEQEQMNHAGLVSGSRNNHEAPSYEQYRKLMMTRQSIREKKRDLQKIMWSFQCRTKQDQISASMTIQNGSNSTSRLEHCDPTTQGEYESWAILEEMLEVADTTLGDHLEMFAQRSALVQAEAANRMARSSGQLTKIATFIVPCSFVASIFSMGGSFAAGESLFFVYWTISLPATLGLLAWVLSKDEDCRRFCRQVLSPVSGKFSEAVTHFQGTEGDKNGREKLGWFKGRYHEQRFGRGQLGCLDRSP